MTLGERIAYYRGKLGLSQGELAEQLGVSRQAVSKWETDAGLPDLERLIALSRLYHITLDELVKGESPEETAEAPEEIPVDAVIAKPAAPSGQKTVGYILLGVGLLCAVLALFLNWALLIPAGYLLICAVLCLTLRRYAGRIIIGGTLLAILLVLFILMQLMPGSPFNDEKLTPDMRAALYAKYGLDQPIYIQFFRYVGNMLRGDLGVSYNISKNTPISQLIQSRLPISIQVGGMAVTLGAIVGLVLGILAALKRDTVVDTIATIISVIGVSVPSYVFALALSYTFGFKFRWFPMLFSAKDIFGSSVLPSISLSMFTMASIARFTRSEMIEVLDSDYMLLAESKGISGPALIFRHALRNALIPIITVLAPLIVDLMTGSLVVEKIFAIPGVGSLLVTAIQSNDYNVVIGLSFIYSAMYIGIMLVVDLLYGIIDPRIRLAKGDD